MAVEAKAGAPHFGRKPLTNLKVSLTYAFTRAFMSILNPYAQT